MVSYDYIIVGVGSVGCVLVNCLSVDLGSCVLLFEVGDKDSSVFINMFVGVGKFIVDCMKYNWYLYIEG